MARHHYRYKKVDPKVDAAVKFILLSMGAIVIFMWLAVWFVVLMLAPLRFAIHLD